MRFLDLFAGIGGFRLALERAGHKCIGFCEIDKFARQTYKANFDTEGEVEWHDITAVTDDAIRALGRVDIITGGFPCQAFSVAGKRGGFEDTRGTLFFDIARIARILKPKYLLLENVAGLLSHDGGDTLATILNTMGELGYFVEWQILNSKDFGVPQNRERVFIVGHFGGEPGRKVFPITGANREAGIEVVADLNRHKYEIMNRVYGVDGIAPTISTMQGGNRQPKIMDTKNRHCRETPQLYDVCPTLQASDYKEPKKVIELARNDEKKSSIQGTHVGHGVVVGGVNYQQSERFMRKPLPGLSRTLRASNHGAAVVTQEVGGYKIRKLTPLECFRLQGFPDSHHDNAKAAGVSDSQLYKQAGNAVTVNVVEVIARRLT